MIPAAFKKIQKDTKIIQIGQLDSLLRPKPLLCKMAAVLKKGAILDFEMVTKLHESIIQSSTFTYTIYILLESGLQ